MRKPYAYILIGIATLFCLIVAARVLYDRIVAKREMTRALDAFTPGSGLKMSLNDLPLDPGETPFLLDVIQDFSTTRLSPRQLSIVDHGMCAGPVLVISVQTTPPVSFGLCQRGWTLRGVSPGWRRYRDAAKGEKDFRRLSLLWSVWGISRTSDIDDTINQLFQRYGPVTAHRKHATNAELTSCLQSLEAIAVSRQSCSEAKAVVLHFFYLLHTDACPVDETAVLRDATKLRQFLYPVQESLTYGQFKELTCIDSASPVSKIPQIDLFRRAAHQWMDSGRMPQEVLEQN